MRKGTHTHTQTQQLDGRNNETNENADNEHNEHYAECNRFSFIAGIFLEASKFSGLFSTVDDFPVHR